MKPRFIPCLLLKDRGLVKTIRFKDPTYLGDPINVVRIFNDKEVDELLVLDITATIEGRSPSFDFIAGIVPECFMPVGYGGGIRSVEDTRTILSLGVEKVSINSNAIENPSLIRQSADLFGSQAIMVSIDVKKDVWGKSKVFSRSGKKMFVFAWSLIHGWRLFCASGAPNVKL